MILLFFVFPAPLRGSPPLPHIALLVSESIRPYHEAVDGFREAFEADYRVTYLKSGDPVPRGEQPDLWVAVGPQAMKEVWDISDSARKMYMMVLHPRKVVDAPDPPCGVPLNLPFSFQLRVFQQAFPQAKSIGILYDPGFNQGWVLEAREAAAARGLTVRELRVRTKKEIPSVLKDSWDRLDVLWLIPDRTVISETIIRYLSKESLLHGTALVGYNQFFLESGAAMAFVIDYKELGRSAARLAGTLVREDFCWSSMPPARLKLNTRALEHLGWRTSQPLSPYVELEP